MAIIDNHTYLTLISHQKGANLLDPTKLHIFCEIPTSLDAISRLVTEEGASPLDHACLYNFYPPNKCNLIRLFSCFLAQCPIQLPFISFFFIITLLEFLQ